MQKSRKFPNDSAYFSRRRGLAIRCKSIDALTAIDANRFEMSAIESPIASLDRVIVVPLLDAADFCATFAELSGASGATGAIGKTLWLKIRGIVTIRPDVGVSSLDGLDAQSGAVDRKRGYDGVHARAVG
jgi:hypothetical protein